MDSVKDYAEARQQGFLKERVRLFYDSVGGTFDASYDWDGPLYPSNRIRLNHALDVLSSECSWGEPIRAVLDAGCGTGIAMEELLRRDYDAWGYDFSSEAVRLARERLGAQGWRVSHGDIEASSVYAQAFDAALVIGALTHPVDHVKALRGLHHAIRKRGLLIVELRNELFNLFTFNGHTVDSLRRWVPDTGLKEESLRNLSAHVYQRTPVGDTTVVERAYQQSQSGSVPWVWRNPLTVRQEYEAAGFEQIDLLYFHWHCVPPIFESIDPVEFRQASLDMEKHPRDWRGLFMASAFLLVCRRV